MKRLGWLVVACFCLSQSLGAGDPATTVVTVIHIDAMPQFTQGAAMLLDKFHHDSVMMDSGLKDFHVLQEIGHANHFTLVETWADDKAYEAHNVARHTRAFRDEIQHMLGSPFDERTHTELNLKWR